MPAVLAIAAHPDDIEFVFAGTMLRLADLGWDLHYVNLCDGSKGSTQLSNDRCAQVRREEALRSCEKMGATFYESIFPDMEAQYTPANLRKVAAIVRAARPSIVLTHSPVDYMEDHEVACRLAVSAAFCHAMPNFHSDPPTPIYDHPVTVYHAQPYGNCTPLCEPVRPSHFVDTEAVIERQLELLACHASQKEWLDRSQGLDSYLVQMKQLAADVGAMSGQYKYAEGWRRHHHAGFCGPDDDPLRATKVAQPLRGDPK
ncbi:MAG: PIG-L family deacetylase [Planctomycetota bacterium]